MSGADRRTAQRYVLGDLMLDPRLFQRGLLQHEQLLQTTRFSNQPDDSARLRWHRD